MSGNIVGEGRIASGPKWVETRSMAKYQTVHGMAPTTELSDPKCQ